MGAKRPLSTKARNLWMLLKMSNAPWNVTETAATKDGDDPSGNEEIGLDQLERIISVWMKNEQELNTASNATNLPAEAGKDTDVVCVFYTQTLYFNP